MRTVINTHCIRQGTATDSYYCCSAACRNLLNWRLLGLLSESDPGHATKEEASVDNSLPGSGWNAQRSLKQHVREAAAA